MPRLGRSKRLLPGFGLTMGFTLLYLSLIVLIPLSALFISSAQMGVADFWKAVSHPRVIASYKLTFGASLIAAIINTIFGFIVAWTLVRYRFPFKRVLDSLVDLPFAMPTAVSGITLTMLYSRNGWIGQYLDGLGIKATNSSLGIVIALTFVGLPFVVRALQPALEDLERENEEAAASLGANRFQTFRRVILPAVVPAILTGFAMSFARGIGEYGSVVFISGNLPYKTEIASLLIVTKLDQYDTAGATAIALVMLLASFGILLLINGIAWWASSKAK